MIFELFFPQNNTMTSFQVIHLYTFHYPLVRFITSRLRRHNAPKEESGSSKVEDLQCFHSECNKLTLRRDQMTIYTTMFVSSVEKTVRPRTVTSSCSLLEIRAVTQMLTEPCQDKMKETNIWGRFCKIENKSNNKAFLKTCFNVFTEANILVWMIYQENRCCLSVRTLL